MSHDFEELLGNIKTVISDNFNTELTSITTDKGDGIILPTLHTDAYALQSMNDEVMNHDPFIAYGLSNIETVSNGPQVHEKLFFQVVIVLADGGKKDINRIMFRYARALGKIFEDNWQIVASGTKINVNRSTVVPFESLDSSASYKAVGIEIEINLAS